MLYRHTTYACFSHEVCDGFAFCGYSSCFFFCVIVCLILDGILIIKDEGNFELMIDLTEHQIEI